MELVKTKTRIAQNLEILSVLANMPNGCPSIAKSSVITVEREDAKTSWLIARLMIQPIKGFVTTLSSKVGQKTTVRSTVDFAKEMTARITTRMHVQFGPVTINGVRKVHHMSLL